MGTASREYECQTWINNIFIVALSIAHGPRIGMILGLVNHMSIQELARVAFKDIIDICWLAQTINSHEP